MDYKYLISYLGHPLAFTDSLTKAEEVKKMYKKHHKETLDKDYNIDAIAYIRGGDMELKIKKMRDNAIIPTRGSKKAAAVDLYACIDKPITINPGEQVTFGSGIACDFPEGYFGAVVPRSSVGIKRHLTLPNNVGVIDEDFNGEIMIALKNIGNDEQTINPGERIAQMILLPYILYNIVETDTLSDTERGEKGIGSTGK